MIIQEMKEKILKIQEMETKVVKVLMIIPEIKEIAQKS